ncbi:39S mitochondrial ribosomal protein L46-domain-containing protein [Mycena metata]|uniref:Large ribosomal subunit protein mL46 n=1 Tax=Mycena metata TaxID=1033252 RepID=A0AAD7NRL5_9AGAR|nr:39S mitochondrial ribosomal protein L46-domain-containing protein [Mycena metata]
MSVPLARPCRRAVHLVSRSLATAAASPSPPPPHTPNKSSKPVLYTSVILNRSPILTPSPTTFERAFYAYQQRMRRALHNPFPSEFYFKQGSLLEAHYNAEERARERIAWGQNTPGRRTSRQKRGPQSRRPSTRWRCRRLQTINSCRESILPTRRETTTVSIAKVGGIFTYSCRGRLAQAPFGSFRGVKHGQGELLHQAAHRDFHAQCGNHMDTWIVARKPIGVYKPPVPETSPERITFFFKAHIMAGQVRPQQPLSDFVWVTKQEIEKRVKKDYWQGVKDMLSDH